MTRRLGWLGWWAVTLAVPLVLVAVDVRAVASQSFLAWEYGRAGFPAAPGFSAADRMTVAERSLEVVRGEGAPGDLLDLRQDGAPIYTAAEVSHLVDVRVLVGRLMRLGWAGIGLIAVAGAAAHLRPTWRGRWRRSLARGGALAAALVVVVGVGLAVAWPVLFTGFHKVFFPPGTWQFATSSGLIRLFPERFWFDLAVVFAAMVLAEGLAIAWLCRERAGDRGHR